MKKQIQIDVKIARTHKGVGADVPGGQGDGTNYKNLPDQEKMEPIKRPPQFRGIRLHDKSENTWGV